MSIAGHIREVCIAGDDHTAIDFNGQKTTWRSLLASIDSLNSFFHTFSDASERGAKPVVGLLGNNSLESVGAFISILGAHRTVLLVNENRASARVAEELKELNLAYLVGARENLRPDVVSAAKETGTLLIAANYSDGALHFELAPGFEPIEESIKKESSKYRCCDQNILIEIQTSGTTGKPKRIPILAKTLEASLRDGVRKAKGAVAQAELKPKSSPTLMFSPLVHTSGVFNTLMAVFEVRPIVLFEKFDVEPFVRAVRQYRPKFIPLPPTTLKMLVDSEATQDDFSSVKAVRSGTAPLSIELQQQFEEKFNVPVLTTYGATEFMGAVASWTLNDHKEYSDTKRGSVGRPSAGVQLRIVDSGSGKEINAGAQGILQAKIQRVDGGKEWISTTDLASIDEDGFLFIHGRTDDAIMRGGFKIMAGKVSETICQHPGVFDAIVLGRPDQRLGEVPVAVVQFYPDVEVPSEAELKNYAKENLTHYEVPVRFLFVENLPRTVSDKISRPETHKLIDRLI